MSTSQNEVDSMIKTMTNGFKIGSPAKIKGIKKIVEQANSNLIAFKPL